MSTHYEKYCFEHLPDEVQRLKALGRTGFEAFIAAASYERRLTHALREAEKQSNERTAPTLQEIKK